MEAVGTVRTILEEEEALCADLAHVLRGERDALTSFSPDGVTACARQKDNLHAKLSGLVARRREVVRALGRELGVTAEDGRLGPLLPHLPTETAAGLREAVARLRENLLQARRLQRVNGALIDATLRMVGDLVRVYREFLPGTRYDDRAMVRPGPTRDAVDQRA
jgi:flagellar biosynthesis/type III secretory pathway chaperone